LLRELLALYDAFASGAASPLQAANWQPSDVAYRERRWAETEEARRQLDFWARTLAEVPKVLELPADRPRAAVESFRGDAVRLRLDAALCARVEAFSRRRRVTPHMTLRAVFEAFVKRLTGLERFVVGTGVANRGTPGLESVVGMVLNNVALPADLSGDPDLETLVGRVRDTAVTAPADPLGGHRLHAFVAADDDFFEIGGHSLAAMQVAARIEEHLAVRLPLRRLFEATTLAELALAVDQEANTPRPAEPAGLFNSSLDGNTRRAATRRHEGHRVDGSARRAWTTNRRGAGPT
jgi:acyl carrier protein